MDAIHTPRSSSGGPSSSGGSKPGTEAISCTRRQFVLDRGPNGLGLQLDEMNTVVAIMERSMAEQQGLMCVGDTVLMIDGASLSGKLMQDVMKPGCVAPPHPLLSSPGGR